MTKFQSKGVFLSEPIDSVHSFLSDLSNYEVFMPDQVLNWQASQDECRFKISGLSDFHMRVDRKQIPGNVHIVSADNKPVPYTLDFFLYKTGDGGSELQVIFHAELNAFMKMMAAKPLQYLVDTMAEKIQERFASSNT